MRIPAIILWLISAIAVSAETRVIDGDTIDLDGQRYRLEGIDAPEAAQDCVSKAGLWACGQAATAKLEALVAGRQIKCEKGVSDGRDRIVARCFAEDTDLSQAMTAGGFAWAFRKYSDRYIDAETHAKARGLGIWSAKNEPAWVFREKRWAAVEQETPEGCPIKGNISASGRIYHLPWMRDYARTRVNLDKGERWFCDEVEALSAGWRAPYRY